MKPVFSLAVVMGIALLAYGDVPPHSPLPQKAIQTTQKNHKGGRWYMAEDGHAVYCIGPQRMLPDSLGGFMKIVTFCQGNQPIVKLKE